MVVVPLDLGIERTGTPAESLKLPSRAHLWGFLLLFFLIWGPLSSSNSFWKTERKWTVTPSQIYPLSPTVSVGPFAAALSFPRPGSARFGPVGLRIGERSLRGFGPVRPSGVADWIKESEKGCASPSAVRAQTSGGHFRVFSALYFCMASFYPAVHSQARRARCHARSSSWGAVSCRGPRRAGPTRAPGPAGPGRAHRLRTGGHAGSHVREGDPTRGWLLVLLVLPGSQS